MSVCSVMSACCVCVRGPRHHCVPLRCSDTFIQIDLSCDGIFAIRTDLCSSDAADQSCIQEADQSCLLYMPQAG